MSEEDKLRSEIARLRAENEMLRRQDVAGLRLKVSEKGALSVYGLGRFPVTLYKEQWRRLLAQSEAILQFMRENDSALRSKGEMR